MEYLQFTTNPSKYLGRQNKKKMNVMWSLLQKTEEKKNEKKPKTKQNTFAFNWAINGQGMWWRAAVDIIICRLATHPY